VLAAIVRQDAHPQDTLFLPDFAKSRNVGFAMKKDEPRMQAAINQALLELEASGEAAKIRDAWFGPGSEQPMQRTFRITAEY
jgi:polar amino acid transport system substrate-binding protein